MKYAHFAQSRNTLHYRILKCAVETLERLLAHAPLAYTSGNMFVYYEKGNKRKHVSPDVFVALGVPKDKRRDAYFTWLEAHGLDLVIELTSASTKDEDLEDKMAIYQNEIAVPDYFLFDPRDEYLEPPLQGFRLREGVYTSIEARIIHRPVADFVRSRAVAAGYGQNSHEFRYAVCDASTGPMNNPG